MRAEGERDVRRSGLDMEAACGWFFAMCVALRSSASPGKFLMLVNTAGLFYPEFDAILKIVVALG
ncbi:hypothetical protein D3870_16740 [Noviherbaspirillum cavernae]|uniref:Uncharacterized protein n=2 Tax=Noviherbaspirillum cavernae TaxID=2320862 RepID=A0A418X4T3_9BURK|nr:hypothetical protein D3870_16740 [Noviherbaspirillum cavernae]